MKWKDDLGRTPWMRFKHWFWCSRVGMSLNILFGNPTAFRIMIEGTILLKGQKNVILRDLYVRGIDTKGEQKQSYLSSCSVGCTGPLA